MAQYKIAIDEAVMQQLFTRDNGLAVLVEQAVTRGLRSVRATGTGTGRGG